MRNALVRLSTVTLDMTDAMELSELLDYLAQWLELADDNVHADLATFAWDQAAMPMVRQRLASFSRLLICGHADFDLDDDLDDGGSDQERSW
jgi:hypothetical protein